MSDFNLTESALKILKERYLQRRPDGTQETPRQMFQRVAGAIAIADREYGASADQVDETAIKFYDLMAGGKFLPNSPTLMNAGLGNNLQYSACYVLPVEDSIEGIFESVKNAAIVHQSGGGTGFAFSRLRPGGSRVNTSGGVASGPVSFMRVFDGATEAVKQGGRRRGANMGVLRVDHPDIEDFITCKLNGGVTNFNISVAITEAFMEALENGSNYPLIAQPGWPRPDGGRYEGGEKLGQKSAGRIFDMIIDAAWHTGDPGLVFIDRVNDSPANPTPKINTIETCNPCVTGDTLIYTENGLVEARSLYYQGGATRVTVDKRLSLGRYQEGSPVFPTGQKEIYRLQTKEGYSLRLTANHKVMTNRGWVKAKDLTKSHWVYILNRKGGFGNFGDRETGLALGWLVGDGYLSDYRATLDFYGEKQELVPLFEESVYKIVDGVQKNNRDYSISGVVSPVLDKITIQSTRLGRLAETYGLKPGDKHKVPKGVFLGTEAMQRGFLQALFSADGTVVGTSAKGISVRLAQSELLLLEQVQTVLLNFGIASRIYKNRRPAQFRKLPDSDRNPKDYWCKAQHELVISKANLLTFQSEIGFIIRSKQEKLEALLSKNKKRGPYQEEFMVRMESLTEDGIEDVYDLTEPVTHSFVANGIVVHNCGEQYLYPNDACNLGSINLAKFVSEGEIDWGGLADAVKISVHFLDNVITVNPYPLPEIDEVVKANRRIGLGVMGWADMLFVLKIPYNSEQALALAKDIILHIQSSAVSMSKKLGDERGLFPNWKQSIYNAGGPRKRRNATLTTIAPTGSISIIAGASSGIEPIFALAFQHIVKVPEGGQRILTFINPIFEQTAKEGGFWSEELQSKILETGSVHGLPEVPEDIQKVFVTAHEIEPEWHVRMQAAFQKHTDNGVSKTINLLNSATRIDIEDAYLLAYETGCLGITVFRDGCKEEQVLNVGAKKPEPSAQTKARPVKLQGQTYRKKTPVGTAYITVNTNGDNAPFEIFINVAKAGSDVAADAEGLGRLISLILRLPAADPLRRAQDIIGQLRGIGSGRAQGFGAGRVMSLPDAVAQALAEHIGLNATDQLPGLPDVDEQLMTAIRTGDLCPECGQATFVFEEGCKKCYGCGFSEC